MTNQPQAIESIVEELLLANFCDGNSWKDADSVTFTKYGALEIALFFYNHAKEDTVREVVERIDGIKRYDVYDGGDALSEDGDYIKYNDLKSALLDTPKEVK